MGNPILLAIFGVLIACVVWLYYITYEPIKKWAWSDVEENKKTHGSEAFNKKQVL